MSCLSPETLVPSPPKQLLSTGGFDAVSGLSIPPPMDSFLSLLTQGPILVPGARLGFPAAAISEVWRNFPQTWLWALTITVCGEQARSQPSLLVYPDVCLVTLSLLVLVTFSM